MRLLLECSAEAQHKSFISKGFRTRRRCGRKVNKASAVPPSLLRWLPDERLGGTARAAPEPPERWFSAKVGKTGAARVPGGHMLGGPPRRSLGSRRPPEGYSVQALKRTVLHEQYGCGRHGWRPPRVETHCVAWIVPCALFYSDLSAAFSACLHCASYYTSFARADETWEESMTLGESLRRCRRGEPGGTGRIRRHTGCRVRRVRAGPRWFGRACAEGRPMSRPGASLGKRGRGGGNAPPPLPSVCPLRVRRVFAR